MLDSWLSKSKIKEKMEVFIWKIFQGKLSANQLSLIGLNLGLISAFIIYLSGIFVDMVLLLIIISIIIMIFSFLFDLFDGAIARLDKPTVFGGIFDIFCDRTVEVFIIIALISTDPVNLMWPGLFLLGAIIICITMFLLVGAAVNSEDLDEVKKVIYYRKGLMERSETFLFLLFITIFYFGPWRFILFWTFAFLVFLTAFLRLKDAYKLLK